MICAYSTTWCLLPRNATHCHVLFPFTYRVWKVTNI